MFLLPGLVSNFLDIAPSIREPIVQLPLRHAGVEGQVVFFGFGGVRIVWVFFYPSDQHCRISSSSDGIGTGGGTGRGGWGVGLVALFLHSHVAMCVTCRGKVSRYNATVDFYW